MRVSRCKVTGLSSCDNEKYISMCDIVDSCNDAGISPPKEALEYIDRYDKGEEESSKHLRPGIDKGVSIRKYEDGDAIIVNLNMIDDSIDIIRIQHEEFEE